MELLELEKENRNETADFLNNIRLRHRITFKALYSCLENDFEEIQRMEDVFDLRNEKDAQILITIPKLFFADDESDNIISFIKAERKSNYLRIASPAVDHYKVLLLSALINNTAFFAMAWNWCGYIRQELLLQEVPQEQEINVIDIIFSKMKYIFDDIKEALQIEQPVFAPIFASHAVSGFGPLGRAFVINGIGILEARCADFELPYLQFKFTPKNDKLVHPYSIEVKLISKNDNKEHTLYLFSTDDSSDHFFLSAPKEGKGIDFKGGIKITNIKFQGMSSKEDV